MIDKATIIQVLGSLIKEPSLLSKTDIYNLTIEDFTSHFEKYIFSAIYNLYQGGARNISIVDIDNYFNSHPVAKQTFEQNKGIEYLQDALDFSDQGNFPFYYKRLKKFNALIDLNKMGFDTSQVYQIDPLVKDAKETNEKFEKLDISDIFNLVKRDFLQIENKYSLGDASATLEATNDIENLLEELKLSPDVGAALQGDIFNTVCRGARKSKFYIRSASSGVGKALPNSTVIPTPLGWRRVDEIQTGDYLFDGLGRPTKVLNVYPQGEKEVYQITFKDGRTARSCNEHLWSFNTAYQRKKSKEQRVFYTKELKEIQKMELQGTDQGYKVFIPMQKAVQYEEKEYFIPPYIFGLILGDGSFRQHPNNKSFQFSSENGILPKKIAKEMNWYLKKSSSHNFTWYFAKKESQEIAHEKINIWVEDVLKDFPELLNKKSCDKFIPKSYLMGSINQRFDLLNGLLDSDGSVSKDGSRISYSTGSKELVDDFIELAQSLGFKTGFYTDSRKGRNDSYGVRIVGSPEDKIKLFKLKRKKDKVLNWYNSKRRKENNLGNAIIKIESLQYQEEMTCFTVDNDEELFLTENFIPTHNTRSLVGDACHTAYPMRFNHDTWQWEWSGSSERTIFIATEQEIDEIQTLILAYLTGFNEEKILYSYYNDKEKIVLEQALKVMKYFEGNFFIVRLPNPSIEQIKAIVRQNWIVYDIQNIFYDYIFSSPSLLNEFRDLRIREDVALMLLSTALKDLAVELGVFIMSATQTNAKQDDARGVKTESVIRGSRAIVDKADIGCVISRINPEELELLTGVIDKYHETPNQVTDMYKVRRGRFTNVKIWSYMDLGTCRKKDLFITGGDFNEVEGFKVIRFKEKEPKTYTISEVINSEFGKKGEKKIIKLKGLEDEERASRETFGDLD